MMVWVISCGVRCLPCWFSLVPEIGDSYAPTPVTRYFEGFIAVCKCQAQLGGSFCLGREHGNAQEPIFLRNLDNPQSPAWTGRKTLSCFNPSVIWNIIFVICHPLILPLPFTAGVPNIRTISQQLVLPHALRLPRNASSRCTLHLLRNFILRHRFCRTFFPHVLVGECKHRGISICLIGKGGFSRLSQRT